MKAPKFPSFWLDVPPKGRIHVKQVPLKEFNQLMNTYRAAHKLLEQRDVASLGGDYLAFYKAVKTFELSK